MGVDVLAVMDPRTELGVKPSGKNPNAGFLDLRDWYAYIGRADEARAAVAELIEADAEFDKARDGYNPLYASRDQLDRYLAAEARRTSALARVTGVQP